MQRIGVAPSGRRASWKPLAWAFLTQGAVLLLTGFVVVLGPILEREPQFVAPKTVYLPQRELEHRAAVAELAQVMPSPQLLQRLTVDTWEVGALPPLPDLPVSAQDALPTERPFAAVDSLLGASGLLAGLGTTAAEASELAFFGLEERATRIVICFDVSLSVKNKVERAGLSMAAVKEETIRALEGLNANTLFGIIQFSRQYDLFRPYLVAATRSHRKAARDWLETEFRTDGTSARDWVREEPNGIQAVLGAAFRLDPAPDALIVVSDGSFQRTPPQGGTEQVPWAELAADLETWQAGLREPARLHFVGFAMRPEDAREAGRLAAGTGGTLRRVE